MRIELIKNCRQKMNKNKWKNEQKQMKKKRKGKLQENEKTLHTLSN